MATREFLCNVKLLYIFSNIDFFLIGKLMPHIFNKCFVFISCKYFFMFFAITLAVLLKLLKHVKIIVKCELLFENIK